MQKLKLEVDLSNPAVVAALNTLFSAMGGLTTVAAITGDAILKVVEKTAPEPEKKEKAPRKVKETFPAPGEPAPEDVKEDAPGEDFKPEEDLKDDVESGDEEITREMVREALAPKVENNRDAVKAKLTSLGGAKNVTVLEPKYFKEMYDFLNGLK